MIGYLILIVVIVTLLVVLIFQMRSAKEAAEDSEQLLKDYQKRINELQKLMDDYRDLQKNFDSVGTGYEQALLAFDKMEEEKKTVLKANENLEKQSNDLLGSKQKLEELMLKKKDYIEKAAEALKSKLDFSVPGTYYISQQANNILNMIDVEMETAIECDDNCMVSDITNQAIRETGIDKYTHISFRSDMADVALGTMLFTNQNLATRALANLLDNAIKFNTGGAVTLYTSVNDANVEFALEDCGVGIKPEDAEKIFEPFTKLNSFFDGAGCGLTVARSIARRLNGDIKVDTDYTRGARFVFTLPI